jgi:uncharacterized membrane protein
MYNPRSGYSAPTVLGIDEKWERVLCYVFGWVSGLIFLLIENKNATVRRHAVQSIVVFGTLSILAAVLGWLSGIWVIGLLFGLLKVLVGLVTFAAWVLLMIAAYASPATFVPASNRY